MIAERPDLVVIGAGPAGLAAAVEGTRHGLGVALLDEQGEPGGQIYRAVESAGQPRRDVLGTDYAAGESLTRAFRASNATYCPDTAVWRVDPDGRIAYSSGGRAGVMHARRVVVATGAMERPVPIRGWTLPGVLGAGAAQVALKSAGLVPDGPVVLAGAGPLLLLVANQLLDAGADVAAVLETTTTADYLSAAPHLLRAWPARDMLRKGLAMRRRLRKARVHHHTGVKFVEAEGAERLEAVGFRAGAGVQRIAAQTLLLHFGVMPNVQITRQLGCSHEWYEPQRHWRPVVDRWGATSIDPIAVAGDGAGILGAEVAARSGRLAALDAAYRLGKIDAARRDALASPLFTEHRRYASIRPLLDTLFPVPAWICRPADATIIVCRCEEVTAGMVREGVKLGARGPNQLKTYTRAGMGPCQGRMCGVTVSELIAEACQVPVSQVGAYRIRPPIKPVTLGEIAAMEVGRPAGSG